MTGAAEVFFVFLRLGLTSFGGPIAHLAYFRTAFVEKRRWIDEAGYADLVALCQFLPGPASNQVGFALGLKRAGWLGGLAAWTGFTAPSAALMIAAAYGVQRLAPETLAPAVHGFKIVAVAVVAHAVVGMAWSLLRTPLQMACAAISATAALLATGALVIPVTIVTIAMAHSALTNRDDDGWAIAAFDRTELRNLVIWSALVGALIGAVQLAGILPTPAQLALGMARIGALVFGGGHAVLPLMEADAIAHGWMGRDAFLAGYGAAQALPGPLFSFAAFAGASAAGAPGALIALVAIFAPGLVLVAIALRWWERLKTAPRAQAFVAGANAAVVGVLAAALWDPLIVSGVRAPADAAVAVVGFALLQWVKAPSWLVVALVAGAGAALAA